MSRYHRTTSHAADLRDLDEVRAEHEARPPARPIWYGRPAWVYRLYDDQSNLLYVGVTQSLTGRLANHQSRGNRWRSEIVRYEAERYHCRDDAERAEADLIASHAPRYNRAGVKPDPMRATTGQYRVGGGA